MTWNDEKFETRSSSEYCRIETYHRAIELYRRYKKRREMLIRAGESVPELVAEPIAKSDDINVREWRHEIDISYLLEAIAFIDGIADKYYARREEERQAESLLRSMCSCFNKSEEEIKAMSELDLRLEAIKMPFKKLYIDLWYLTRIDKDTYKKLAHKLHPDKGGSVEDMQRLNEVYKNE